VLSERVAVGLLSVPVYQSQCHVLHVFFFLIDFPRENAYCDGLFLREYLPTLSYFAADFRGELITSYIDGAQILHFPSHKRTCYVVMSVAGVTLLLLLALGVLVSIYIIRFTLEDNIGIVKAQILASVLNAGQIQVLNYFYSHVLRYLTHQENHR
jgi:hypothetical protein